MASIQARLLQGMFRLIGINKMLDKTGSEFDALLEEYAGKQTVKVPFKKMRKRYDFEERTLGGVPCYITKQKNTSPEIAVLYLFGGGYILPPDPGDFVLGGQIADNSNAEVWFPLYPMAPGHNLRESVESTLEVYREMLKTHAPENIRFFGTSSGGGLCMSILLYIKKEAQELPMPGRLVLQSPGLQVPPSEKQKEKMNEIAPKDCMIPPRFFDNIAPVLATGEDAYLLSPLLNDLTGFPELHVFYGSNECMIAYLDDLKKVCKRDKVKLHSCVGKDMMHCWGAMEFVPEAKRLRKIYFELLSCKKVELSQQTSKQKGKKGFMPKTSQEYKELSKKEFTKAALKYESSHAGIYELCKKDYPDILAEVEKEPFETLLDAGCGPAPMLTLMSEKYPDKHYTGLDLTEAMIEQAKKKNLSNADFVVGDCENLPFPENSFDVIICVNSAHHYPNLQNFFNSAYRVLKPNGRLILRDMTSENTVVRFLVSHLEMPLANASGHGDVDMLRREECEAGMKKAGLAVEISELRPGMRMHMVARKK